MVLVAMDMWHAWHDPGVYPFGGEGPVAGAWTYGTQTTCLLSGAILVACAMPAVVALWASGWRARWRWLLAVPLVVMLSFSVLDVAG